MIVGHLADDWGYLCENDAFAQFDYTDLSYLDEQFLPAPQHT
jgi:hypothetical protein